MTQQNKPKAFDYFKPPFKYEPMGQTIYCDSPAGQAMCLQVRGWGNLIGGGGCALPYEQAEVIQDEFGQWVATLLNTYDRRVTELLEANNRLVERARNAERVNLDTLAFLKRLEANVAQHAEIVDLIGGDTIAALMDGRMIAVTKPTDDVNTEKLTEADCHVLDGVMQHGATSDDDCEYVVMTNRQFVDYVNVVRKFYNEKVNDFELDLKAARHSLGLGDTLTPVQLKWLKQK